MTTVDFLLLLLAANGMPLLVRLFMGPRLAWPVDAGRLFFDGRPLLGPAKTWRGVAASLAVTALLAAGLGLSWTTGMLVAALAMAGDLLSSFTKRRLGIAAHHNTPGVDQLPESLLPLLVLLPLHGFDCRQILSVTAAFWAIEAVLTWSYRRLRVRLRRRRRRP